MVEHEVDAGEAAHHLEDFAQLRGADAHVERQGELAEQFQSRQEGCLERGAGRLVLQQPAYSDHARHRLQLLVDRC